MTATATSKRACTTRSSTSWTSCTPRSSATPRTVLNKPIGYDGSTNPYWFFDTNGNGVIDGTENVSNTYNAFSVRLLKAAYNYQVATKDPNNFAHNGKYVIELLYDSIEDLNAKLAVPTDSRAMSREDEGHFNGGCHALPRLGRFGRLHGLVQLLQVPLGHGPGQLPGLGPDDDHRRARRQRHALHDLPHDASGPPVRRPPSSFSRA